MPWKVKNDLTGMRFGDWTVLYRDLERKRPMRYMCRCKCGKEQLIPNANLTTGKTKSCLKCAGRKQREFKEGDVVGKATILRSIEGGFIISCSCGNMRTINGRNLKHNQSCGWCRFHEMLGRRYGSLKVIGFNSDNTYQTVCTCGEVKSVTRNALRTKAEWQEEHGSSECSCKHPLGVLKSAEKLVGTRYGLFTIEKHCGFDESKRSVYLLRCQCGNSVVRNIKHVFGAKSCGCLREITRARGSKCGHSKMREDEVLGYRALYKTDLYTLNELADMAGVDSGTMSKVVKRKTWKHVK